MHSKTSAFLVIIMSVMACCQLFNDLLPRGRPGDSKNGLFDKTINFDTIKLNERPGAKSGYLPPQLPTYLPPTASKSTPGPTYLPPSTTRRTTLRPISYMPPMGTFPTVKYYNYTTRYTTTRKPMPPPSTLPPLTTTIRTTTGYYYDKPNVAFNFDEKV